MIPDHFSGRLGSTHTCDDALITAGRGFAAMNPALQRQIASKGGKTAHLRGSAHEFDSQEARDAGHKGGMSVSRDRAHMAAIGQKGGKARRLAAVRIKLVH